MATTMKVGGGTARARVARVIITFRYYIIYISGSRAIYADMQSRAAATQA
eukprot:SAG31_NODE_1652_length_7628_cov_100.866118_6_plen_50_part_00